MKNIYIAVLILIYLPSFGQTTKRLDDLNGFKEFKFGTLSKAYSSLQEKNILHLKGVKQYKYIGSDYKYLYGVPIRYIIVSFFRDKLYSISIYFGIDNSQYSLEQFILIKTNFETNFGSDYYGVEKTSQANIVNGCIWEGQKVRLEHVRILDEYNYYAGYAMFYDKILEKQQQLSELE